MYIHIISSINCVYSFELRSCINCVYRYQCAYVVNIPQPVQYQIYTLEFPFDLRCESVTCIVNNYCNVVVVMLYFTMCMCCVCVLYVVLRAPLKISTIY